MSRYRSNCNAPAENDLQKPKDGEYNLGKILGCLTPKRPVGQDHLAPIYTYSWLRRLGEDR
jgi:hypothetical protein